GRGLAHAHAAGVVHRDLKPGNVFLVADGPVKILDFGTARTLGDAELVGDTETAPTGTAFVGTPGYMPPERLAGERGDARTDVFGLGVVLYRMLVGRMPYRYVGGALEPSEPAGDLPEEIAPILARALALEPRERYADAGELVAALAQ